MRDRNSETWDLSLGKAFIMEYGPTSPRVWNLGVWWMASVWGNYLFSKVDVWPLLFYLLRSSVTWRDWAMCFDDSKQGKSLSYFPRIYSSPGTWLTGPRVESGLSLPGILGELQLSEQAGGPLLRSMLGQIWVISPYPGLSDWAPSSARSLHR